MALHDTLKPTSLFRPGFWLHSRRHASCVVAWPARATPAGAFAIAVAGSAAIYVLTFLPFGVAADFRYGYWCVPACLVAAAALFAAYRERAPGARPDERADSPATAPAHARASSTTLSMMAAPSSADAARGIADDAVARQPRIVGAPGPARAAIEDQRPDRCVGLAVAPSQLAPHQIGREREHHRGLAAAAMHVGHRASCVDLGTDRRDGWRRH